jgi:NAD(P)-dependent dehydrogenase (short-subunit alcohol dehydrogenase family)
MPGAQQIARHGQTHSSQANEADVHGWTASFRRRFVLDIAITKRTCDNAMRTDSMPGNDRVGVVVGGGNGIGEAACRLMHERGWRVVVVDNDSTAARRVAADVGGRALVMDISREDEVENAAREVETAWGVASALVVAAAMFQNVVPPAQLPTAVWERTLEVNLTGTWLANRAFGTRMAAAGAGSIVNIASIAAIASMPVHAYGTSKAAVVALTKNLAGEWGRSGVRVNAVSPGSTLVPRVEERIKSGRYAADPAEFTALGRMVQPNEVAEAIEFLASDRASAITGINLVVDAGWQIASTWAQHGGLRAPTKR